MPSVVHSPPPAHLDAAFLAAKHQAGLAYEEYLASNPVKAENWRKLEAQLYLTEDQQKLVRGFTREIKILAISGIWCGDCVAQCPMLVKIAQATRRQNLIDLKFVDRDVHIDLSQRVMINAGLRVPTVIFMAEDFEPVSILGDRTLTRYRSVAALQLGPSCPLPGAAIPQDELNVTLQEWLNEIERVHLLLRLSARLRERHGD